MKKTLAAVAVLGAFAGSALAADVQLYGIVDEGLAYSHVDLDGAADATDSFSMNSGMQSGSRFGFKGTEDLGNGLTVGFILEHQFHSDDGSLADADHIFRRESSLFLQGGFGKVAMGRMGSINGVTSSWAKYGVLSAFGTSWDYSAQAGSWAIGGGSWWGDNDDALSVKAILTAVEQGITWVDTAPIYGLYHSEEVVGEAMKHIDRDKVVLSTKCGLEWRHESPILHKVVDGVQVYRDLSAKGIIKDVEDSLRRLHTDHLDVLYTHWQSPDFGVYPLEETMEAMMKLKEQGKIRAIGASNVTSDIIRGYCKYGQLDVIQEKYSLLTRRVEKQLLPTCKELGVSVQAYSPLEQGLLTGKVTMDTTYPEGSTRNTNPCFQPTRRAQAL